MQIDSHQHFWRYDAREHIWMTDAMSALKRDYLPEELWPLLQASNLQGTVAVQARQNLQETEWLLALAEARPFILGVVGWVDLRSPEVHAQLQRYAAHPKLVGVRHIVHDEPDDRFMLQPAFLRGLGLLADFDLAYDLLLFPKHLLIAAQVVAQFPRQRFVLDHIAKPLIKDQVTEPWETDLRALARFENVYCKLSGLVTEAAWRGWRAADFTRYLEIVYEAFGEDRLMFGSDWPVCTLSADYAQVVSIVQQFAQRFSTETQAKLFGRNAAAFYKLPNP